jgi:hypothetical protein
MGTMGMPFAQLASYVQRAFPVDMFYPPVMCGIIALYIGTPLPLRHTRPVIDSESGIEYLYRQAQQKWASEVDLIERKPLLDLIDQFMMPQNDSIRVADVSGHNLGLPAMIMALQYDCPVYIVLPDKQHVDWAQECARRLCLGDRCYIIHGRISEVVNVDWFRQRNITCVYMGVPSRRTQQHVWECIRNPLSGVAKFAADSALGVWGNAWNDLFYTFAKTTFGQTHEMRVYGRNLVSQ